MGLHTNPILGRINDLSALYPVGIERDFNIIHEQLPLPVPCYDLLPVIEFTLGPDKRRLGVPPTPLS